MNKVLWRICQSCTMKTSSQTNQSQNCCWLIFRQKISFCVSPSFYHLSNNSPRNLYKGQTMPSSKLLQRIVHNNTTTVAFNTDLYNSICSLCIWILGKFLSNYVYLTMRLWILIVMPQHSHGKIYITGSYIIFLCILKLKNLLKIILHKYSIIFVFLTFLISYT